jgi:hypothetical protein
MLTNAGIGPPPRRGNNERLGTAPLHDSPVGLRIVNVYFEMPVADSQSVLRCGLCNKPFDKREFDPTWPPPWAPQ